jgi:hypothetical protein
MQVFHGKFYLQMRSSWGENPELQWLFFGWQLGKASSGNTQDKQDLHCAPKKKI